MQELKKLIKQLIKKIDLCFNIIKKTKGKINMEENNQVNIYDIANYIIEKCPNLTHMKMHKLIYYSHAKYLIENNGKPLVNIPLKAWLFGPVFPKLYKIFTNYQAKIIQEKTQLGDITKINSQIKNILDYIILKYGHLTGQQLSDHFFKEI